MVTNEMKGSSRKPFPRAQRTTIVYGVLGIVVTLVILQLWLLTATMNAFLGGDFAVIWPAAAVSLVCLLLNLGLLKYVYAIDGTAKDDKVTR
jgi:hypothetical protein